MPYLFTLAGIVLVLAGDFTAGVWQIGLWIAAVAVLIFNTIDAGGGNWLVRPGHFAERHGLIVIVALGEVVVAIGAPVVETLSDGQGFEGNLVAALTASGLLAGTPVVVLLRPASARPGTPPRAAVGCQ